MEIRLIAADMDGTLLNDEKKIPEENLRAFKACASQGIEIVPATGRTMRGLPDELRNLPGVHYAILTNGAQVVDLQTNEDHRFLSDSGGAGRKDHDDGPDESG